MLPCAAHRDVGNGHAIRLAIDTPEAAPESMGQAYRIRHSDPRMETPGEAAELGSKQEFGPDYGEVS